MRRFFTATWLFLLLASVTTSPLPAHADEADDEAVLEALKQRDAKTYRQLLDLRESNPKAYRTRLDAARVKFELRASHPELFDAADDLKALEAKVDERVVEYLAAEDSESKNDLYDELQEMAEQAYDLKQESYRDRIGTLRLRLEELEKQLADREERRDELVQQYLDEKLGK